MLTYASPEWFLCATPQPITWKSYTELHAGLLLGASLSPLLSTSSWGPIPSSKAHSKTSGPLLLRTWSASPPRLLQPYAQATRNASCRLKKKPSWRSFCSSATQPLPSPRETLIMCPPFPPWTATQFTVSPFIPDRTGNSTARLQSASSRLSSLPPSDIQDGLTDLSPPFLAPVVLECMSHAPNATHPIPCPFPLVQSPPANLCPQPRSRSVYLPFDDLQIPVSPFPNRLPISPLYPFISPSYLLPESLRNVWSLASFLSNNTTLCFQWVPGHAGLPGIEKADLLAKAGASLPTDAIPCPLPLVIAKVRYSQYQNWRRHISHFHLNFQVPEVFSEELLLSCPIRCELSCLHCHGHSLLLFSYLHRISRKENSACSACGHPLQDLNHLLLDCPASEPLRKSIFGSYLSILDLWSRPWGVARLLGLHGVPPRPHPSEGVG